MKKLRLASSTAIAILGMQPFMFGHAETTSSITEMLSEGDTSLSFRYRYELVDQDGVAEDANASTLKSRLTYKSASYEGYTALMEVDNVTVIGAENYRTPTNGNVGYPIVADPDGTDFNQAYLTYKSADYSLSGMKNQNTIQAELLASHGITVISIDHAYDAYLTIFADGSAADYRSSDTENRTGDAFWAFRLPQLKTRVADLAFVLDEVARRRGESGSLWSNIKTDDVGVFGHSFGGATALMLAAQDDRVARAMALDGWMVPVPPEVIAAGTPKPFYYLGQAAWDDPINYKKLDKFLSASPLGQKQLAAGTKHFDYSDAPQFSNLAKRFGLSGKVSRSGLRALINDAVMSFFIQEVSSTQAIEANLDQ
jgi:dienelactone hydrolase